MLKKFQNHIQEKFPDLLKSRFFIAVSGGIDSMVLVHLFQEIGYPFAILHCNFQLRGEESDGDMRFICNYADKFDIPWSVGRFETEAYAKEMKVSIQLAARELRYDWFQEQLFDKGFDYILTAHQADDTIETFLINLSRGTGLDGLTGIPEKNGQILRPLLPFSRDEIEQYAKENSIQWREDSSNASDKYLRNKIRHHILPVLKELNPNFNHSFRNTLEFLSQSKSLVTDAASFMFFEVCRQVGDEFHIDIKKLLELENFKAYLHEWLRKFGFTAWEDIYGLIYAQSGKQIFSDDYRLIKNRDVLILAERTGEEPEVYPVYEDVDNLNVPLKITVCNTNDIHLGDKHTIFVDKDTLKFPLEFRKWEEGDYFYPFGMTGRKKLSKYFKDEKFSLTDKENTWLLCSENEIVWVVGKRADRRFSVSGTTRNIIKIELK